MSSLSVLVLALSAACARLATALHGTAALTYYISYAPCCPDNDNYDPDWPTTECDLYSACDYAGLFAALDGQQTVEFVQSHSLIAFFDRSDASNSQYYENYANKNVTLVKDGTLIFQAVIVDACGDTDCDGCCSTNAAETGYLVDLEYYTALRFFGDVNLASGTIDFYIDEKYPEATTEIPSNVPTCEPSAEPSEEPSAFPSGTPSKKKCREGAHEFSVDISW